MPKGRNKPTPMVMFMNEHRAQMEALHKRKFKLPFDEDLYVLCKPMYDELSEVQKQHYKNIAKQEWTGIRDDKNKKLTCDGFSVAQIEREKEEMKRRKMLEHVYIKEQFKFDVATILPLEIVVIHVNWFCKINEEFVIAEVALARFSLKKGYIDSYHCYPNFENMFPPGSKGEARLHSERTHKIPVIGFTRETKSFPNIFVEIIKFLKNKSEPLMPDETFALYTMDDSALDVTSRSAVKFFLNQIVEAVEYSDDLSARGAEFHEKYFKLFDLARLLVELKKKDPQIREQMKHFTIDEGFFTDVLRKNTYLQSPNIACEYHDEQDVIPRCSKARCISWIYLVCDQCQFMGMRALPGHHIPHHVSSGYVVDEEETRRCMAEAAASNYCDTSDYRYEDGYDNEYESSSDVSALDSGVRNMHVGSRRY